MSSRARVLLARVLLLSALFGCEREQAPELVARASFGIFFGGQVQNREEIPFELDRARQEQGFRIDFSEPLAKDVKVGWEIDRPAAKRSVKGPERIVELGEAVARKGLSRFDHTIAFRPGDTLGAWKILVRVEGKPVIDRSVTIYDPASRPRQ